jgi:hypothetical protein
MRTKAFSLGVLALGGLWSLAAGQEPAKVASKQDYTELSRMVHKMVAAQFPKVFEKDTGWGQTIPVPDKLRLQRLRTRVMVGGREELPHGLWRKVRAQVNDPEKDLTVRVRGLEKKEGSSYRLTLDVDAALSGEMEVQSWRKGLLLLNLIGQGDVVVGIALECDVAVALDPKQPLGKVKLTPKVVDLKMSLKEFTLRQVALRRLGPILEGEQARAAGEQLKGFLETQLRSLEAGMKDRFNEAIAQGLADGKGTVPVAEIMKALSPPGK